MERRKIDFISGNHTIGVNLSSTEYYLQNPRTGQLNQFQIVLPVSPVDGDWFRFTTLNDGTEPHPSIPSTFISTKWVIRSPNPTRHIVIRVKDIHQTITTPLPDGLQFGNAITKHGDFVTFIFVKGYWVTNADTANGLVYEKHIA